LLKLFTHCDLVSLPVTAVSSCCFGGTDLTDLYITTAAKGADKAKEPLAGIHWHT
jgi:sugar lactone lactonase YvrE